MNRLYDRKSTFIAVLSGDSTVTCFDHELPLIGFNDFAPVTPENLERFFLIR